MLFYCKKMNWKVKVICMIGSGFGLVGEDWVGEPNVIMDPLLT